MNTYSARTYLPALNPLARKYRAAKARPTRKFFGGLTARMVF